MPFANFMIANSAGAVARLSYGLAAYYLGNDVEELARPFALAPAVLLWCLDDPLLAAQGTRASDCSRAGHSQAVADGGGSSGGVTQSPLGLRRR